MLRIFQVAGRRFLTHTLPKMRLKKLLGRNGTLSDVFLGVPNSFA